MEEPLMPAEPETPGEIAGAQFMAVLASLVTVPLWFVGFFLLQQIMWTGWAFLLACMICCGLFAGIHGYVHEYFVDSFVATDEGRAWVQACDRYEAALAQWEHDHAVWAHEVYRYNLQVEAMNDWVRMTGGEYQPTVEWVVNRMHEIEQQRSAAAFQRQQIQLQQAQLAATAAIFVQQARTVHAIQTLPQREAQLAWEIQNGIIPAHHNY